MANATSGQVRTLEGMSPELAGLAEIAEMLDVTKRTAMNYMRRDDFPEPVERLASGPVWRYADVQAWAETNPVTRRGRRRPD